MYWKRKAFRLQTHSLWPTNLLEGSACNTTEPSIQGSPQVNSGLNSHCQAKNRKQGHRTWAKLPHLGLTTAPPSSIISMLHNKWQQSHIRAAHLQPQNFSNIPTATDTQHETNFGDRERSVGVRQACSSIRHCLQPQAPHPPLKNPPYLSRQLHGQ